MESAPVGDAPQGFAADEVAVWTRQAPLARANGTLTAASMLSFERYCQIVALEQRMARTEEIGKGNHRGLLRQINAYELQFNLTPCGKPLASAEPEAPSQPAPKLARFRQA